MQKIHPNIYVESDFHGVTVGAIVTGAGIVCVDAPTLPAEARNWQRQLMQLDAGPLLFVINTDHNRDRVLGNQWLETSVIAHEETYRLMWGYPEIYRTQRLDLGGDFHAASDLVGVRTIMPEVSFTTEMVLGYGGSEIILLHRPGSAPGAAWICVPEAKTVFTGDTVFRGTHPFLLASQLDDWLDNLTKLRKAPFVGYTIVPGRGEPTDKTGLQFSVNYLRYLRRRLLALRARGKPSNAALGLAPALLQRFPVAASADALMTSRLQAGLIHAFETLRD